jgi:hypothetical protein
MKNPCFLSIILATVAFTLFSGCDQKAKAPTSALLNHSPEITSLIADSVAVDPGQVVNITCQADDPDGDLLDYYWTVDGSESEISYVLSNGNKTCHASWISVDQSGVYHIIVTVSDRLQTTVDTLTVSVNLPAPDLSGEAIAADQIRLSWNYTQPQTDSMEVQRSSSPTSNFTAVGYASVAIGYFIDTDLTPLAVYYYRIIARGDQINSSYSNILSVFAAMMPDSGLMAWYPCNGNADDASGHGNDGNPIFTNQTMDRFGISGRALYFNGVDAHLELPPNVLQLSEFTVVLWMNWTDNVITNQPLLSARNAQNGSLWITPSNPLFQYRISDGATTNTLQVGPPLPQNTWTMVALKYAAGTAILYRNSQPVVTGPIALTPQQIAATSFWVGGDSTLTKYFKGSIDDIRLYDRALGNDEIELLYHDGAWNL